MTQETVLGPLDGNTLKELARVICGDDHLYYRRGFEIAQFLENAGWHNVPEYDGEYRGEWTLQLLMERRENPTELEKVLLRLADAREYLGEPEALPTVVSAVNTFLVHEGFRLENPGGRPRVVVCDPAMAHPGHQAPVELKATMAEIIREPRMAALLQRRLDEARTCFSNGAHVAAIIMLGSLLEGVLLTVIEERNASLLSNKDPNFIGLKALIDICHQAGWIDVDMERFSQAVCKYRNFVHPRREFREAHTPDRDTLTVSWYVVNGALNDLAASQPEAHA
ncbi:hypothetical protein GCM10010300_15410 [Streptomyces olivaceoviridis]|uniref:hypothetical protein n=1 Tax=Streptomyces olivaceoviridis TaxID=1921 RepID=UPI001674BD93|nr:hypothetical protein [Streptomyces olivaceoviridis]GGY72966.1 hypothetical protein GCM10010300_15410 [Streptomyces olivaceoviridis]